MALVEINLKKPALVEEIAEPRSERSRGRDRTEPTDRSESASTGRSERSSGRGKLKLLGLLAAVIAVGAVVTKLKGRGTDGGEQSGEYEHGPEPEIGGDESSGRIGKVAGLLGVVAAVVSTVAIAYKRRT